MHPLHTCFRPRIKGRFLRQVIPLGLLTLVVCLHATLTRPRARAVAGIPVAFWSWRKDAPSNEEWEHIRRQTGATALFLRAGQFDNQKGAVRRIRASDKFFPTGGELHLTYNATRDMLREFENIETTTLARIIAETFAADLCCGEERRTRISGLQLDFDVPTRLLPRYAALLRQLRSLLTAGTKLSVTGLPTWMNAPDLGAMLAETDFWIPQLYGAEIPTRIDRRRPISSPAAIAAALERIQYLGKPCYAGLAAYGYAILYSAEGHLLALRGDLDPARVVAHPHLELIEQQPFADTGGVDGQIASEWRYVYRATRDCVINGLAIRGGEKLLLDLPDAAALRAGARIVRERAGEELLGICVFRLPSHDDATVLTLPEVAAALQDQATRDETAVSATWSFEDGPNLNLYLDNPGSASALMGPGALLVDIQLPPGSAKRIFDVRGVHSIETLCQGPDEQTKFPCSRRLADVIRLHFFAWRPGDTAEIHIRVPEEMSFETIPATIIFRRTDGQRQQQKITAPIGDGC